MRKLKTGDNVRIVKYKAIQMEGIIVKKDPILSANRKKVIAFWYIVKIVKTSFGFVDDTHLYTKYDLEYMPKRKGHDDDNNKDSQ